MLRYCRKLWPVILLLTFMTALTAFAADNPPVAEGWPREGASKGMTAMIYEPQVDSWDGFNLKAHSAVAVRPAKREEPVYGVITFTARTLVDKSERIATLEELQITEVKFPSAADRAQEFRPVLQLTAREKIRIIALDSLEAALVASDLKVGGSLPVKNDVPQIIIADKPAILVYIDGAPRYVPVKDADGSLWRVLNTRVLLLKDASGRHYLRLFDGYMEAPSLEGPWRVSARPPKDAGKARKAARESGQVDFMEGQADPKTKELPSLKNLAPQIYIATSPSELVVTEGEPNFVPLAGTELLYVTNTTGNIFQYLRDNRTYLLLAGRWFRAASLAGPWEYVPHKSLPGDFARIPDDSPKENVKAAVPDTVQAREALVANSIPQTTSVKRGDAGFVDLVIDGEPELATIQGTPLSYVSNCSTPVIMVDRQSWYAVQNGIWFTAPALDGPWVVADTVPEVIYTIPTSSPLHYVTYVKVYGTTPEAVYVGYTPGYMGTVITEDVVVYGTGYSYSPWIGSYWYGPPLTYGLGVSIGWTPWWGWGFGFGWGWGWGAYSTGWCYPPTPWWGPYWGRGHHGWRGHHAWGPGGWAHSGTNIYPRRWEGGGARHSATGSYPHSGTRWSGRYGSAYNSRTGSLVAGQKGVVRNVNTNRYAADAKGNITRARRGQSPAAAGGRGQGGRTAGGSQVFATREGSVYRSSARGNWQSVNSPGKAPEARSQGQPRDFSRAAQGRQLGQQRYQSFRANRPSGGFQPARSAAGSGGGISRPAVGTARPSGGGSGGGVSRPSGGGARPSGGGARPSGGGSGHGGGRTGGR
ncbi:MAG: autotransporter [Deltaproteobacteria bacterium]|nr:autotransporter [Deltaproteobacteria bacterium]